MASLRRRFACGFVCMLLAAALAPARASDVFPFGRELILDAAPMRGSKRVPILEIGENGAASINLWCASARGQANVGADSITIVTEPVEPAQCAPERQSRDESLLSALTQVTNWRRRGEVIEFLGTTTLRFRLLTN
jgi:META domain-containing protein